MSNPQTTNWQSIETAPKDRDILLFKTYFKIKVYAVGRWSPAWKKNKGFWEVGGFCSQKNREGDWYTEYNKVAIRQPTHWMDLPYAP
jgi:hypothetical protein